MSALLAPVQGTLRSINEGRHTPRPRRSPPAPPYPQALPPGPAPEAESEPFIGPPRPPRDAWGEAVPSISTAADAVTSMPNGTDSQRSAAEPTGTALSSVSIPAQGFSVAHSGSPASAASGQPLRLEGQAATASAMVAEGAETAQGGAAAAADRAATDQPQAVHAAPSSSTAAVAAQPPGHSGPGSSTPTRPAAGLVLDCSSDSDSDSDSELGAEEDDSDYPDNPCRETLLAFYTHICAVERGNRSGRAPDSQPGSATKATSVGELQAALHSNVAQVNYTRNGCSQRLLRACARAILPGLTAAHPSPALLCPAALHRPVQPADGHQGGSVPGPGRPLGGLWV